MNLSLNLTSYIIKPMHRIHCDKGNKKEDQWKLKTHEIITHINNHNNAW
jgi:hypothetical protein